MKIKFLFNNSKTKSDQVGKANPKGDTHNPNETGFFEFDLDVFNKLREMLPSQITNYYDEINKVTSLYSDINTQIYSNMASCYNEINEVIAKYTNTYNLTYPNIANYYNEIFKSMWNRSSTRSAPKKADGQNILPVNGHDIYNYVARFGMANYQIQTVMKLDGNLEFKKLQESIRLSIDEQPVFGCRFIEADPPYWKRLVDIDINRFCSFEETDNSDEAVFRFLESPLDMDNDLMVKVKLIRSGQNDTLCIKTNHACCDGTGTKEYIKLISDIYSCIDDDFGIFIPKPHIRSRNDQDKLFHTLGITDPDSAWDPLLEAPKTMWTFPWQQGNRDIARTTVCKLPNGIIDTISAYGKTKGASINDLLLTALYRAMFEMCQSPYGLPMDISLTVDLRRYLPNQKTEAIRNFSGGFDIKMPRVDSETFEGTLSRVVPIMNGIKNGRPGLQSAVGLERVEKANFNETLVYYQTAAQYASYSDKCAPVLSNLGFVSKSNIKFGKITVTDAYIVPPAVSPPGLLLVASTYNNVLTLSTSHYEAQVSRDTIERLLNMIKNELMEGCKL